MIPINEGDCFKTISNRITSPIPKINYKRESLNQKNLRGWLKSECISEALARGDNFNFTQFRFLDITNWSSADYHTTNLYLFNDIDGYIGKYKI